VAARAIRPARGDGGATRRYGTQQLDAGDRGGAGNFRDDLGGLPEELFAMYNDIRYIHRAGVVRRGCVP